MNINKIKELDINIYYDFDYDNHNNSHVKNIHQEIINISDIFTEEIIQEVVLSKNDNITKLVKLLCLEYMNEYEFIIIIFQIYVILDRLNIKIKKTYRELQKYVNELSKKSRLVYLLNLPQVNLEECRELFTIFSKLFHGYFDFNKIYDKVLKIQKNNKIILENKENLEREYDFFKYYHNIFEKSNRSKFKVNKDITHKFFKILKKIKKIE